MIPRYLLFHAAFVVPPIAALLYLSPLRADDRRGLAILVPVALAYTVPWDGHLIRVGVWWYGAGSVTTTLWDIPLGEYLFIVVQPVLTGLWLSRFEPLSGASGTQSLAGRLAGVAGGLAVSLAGLALLSMQSTFYIGAVLAWAGPVLALQWAFDWPYLWRRRRTVLVGTLVPTLYLAAVDRVAIEAGIWKLSATYTTGLTVGGLPIEEGAFFLVTNLFVVQGLVLFRGLVVRLRDQPSTEPVADAVSR